MGRFLKRTNYPLYKIPVERPSIIDNVEDGIKYTKDNMLFNIKKDYLQTDLITDEKIENKYIELIKKGLKEMDAPEEQYERLNLK